MSKHNNKLKRTALAGALLVSVSSTPSHAFLLCNDFPALAENMYGHIQDAMAYAQQKAMAAMDMDMEALFNQMTMDQKDKIAAYEAFNAGRIEQEVQNKQIQKEMAGNASEACSAVTASKGYAAAMCASTNEQKVSLAKQAMSTIDRAVTAKQFEAVQLRAAKKLEDACFAESGGAHGAWDGVSSAMRKTKCHRADLLTGTTGAAMTKAQVESAKKSIDLIVRPVPVDRQNYSISPDSDYNREQRLKGLRRSSIKMLASKSLNEVLRFSTPDASGISPEAALDRFNDERYSDPKGCWAAKWSGKPKAGCKRIGTSFTEDVKLPPQVLKEQLVIQGYMSNLATLQYKQSLRMEALQAAMVALEVDPL